MATLTKVLKTDVMADLDMKALAQILRSKGRGRDTVLAHITPKEAALLKRRGGSGTTNPDTGLPEYEFEGDYGGYGGAESYGDATAAMPAQDAAQAFVAPDVTGGTYVTAAGNEIVPGGEGGGYGGPGLQLLSAPGVTPLTTTETGAPAVRVPSGQLNLQTPEGLFGALPSGPTAATTGLPEPGYFDRLGTSIEKQLQDPATLARLGLGIGGSGLGFLQQQRGARQAKQAQRQVADIGAPYRAQGQELIAQARGGELSPASMQAYQAAQAQIAQQTARQGGVGAAQGAVALERMREQLLQNQYNLGLRVANIGDQYMRGAIQTGMQANQALNQASTQFFTNLAATLSGPTVQSLSAAR